MRFKLLFMLIFSATILLAGNFVPGEILIQLENNRQDQAAALEQIRNDLPSLGIKEVRMLSARMAAWLINFDNARYSEASAILELNSHPLVRISQYNHYVTTRETYPDDPDFTQQWHLENTGQSGGLIDADIDATEAWDINTGGVTALGDTLVLAIIDSGNYLNHEDLNFWKNDLEIPGNGIDDDNNGYIDDFDGWNAVSHNGNIDNSSHGTHVSGIAGARGSNNTGVTGVNWEAKIMPIRGSSSTESVVVEAYGYVLEMRSRYNETSGAEGAFVVVTNASFGVNYGDPDDFPIWCAIYDSLGLQGVLSCGATMNINCDVDLLGDMPTACDSDYLITVTNTTDEDLRNSGAAYGLTTIDLGAPGTSIYSTDLANSYSLKTGTSMACPQVTGAVAFLFSAAPAVFMQNYLTQPAEYALLIKQYLLDGTDPLACLNGITVTGGRLNINNPLDYFEQEPEQYEVSGNITTDVTWQADTVHVVGDVFIENSVTVTIPAGTRIQFEDYYKLDVQGTILAQGTETDSIRFTVADTTGFINPYLPTGGWNGINFSNVDPANESSIFTYCIFEYGKAIENYQPVEGGCFEIISTPQVEFNNCSFSNNYAGYGGTIYCEASQLEIQNCGFNNNLAAFSGGSIFASDSSQINVSSCNFNSNLALQGGAIHITASDLTLNDNEFGNNLTRPGQVSAGGALYLLESSYDITGNLFHTNQSGGSGGGVYIEGNGSLPHRILSNRFLGNITEDNGGSICLKDNSQIEIINNLIVNSTAAVAAGLFLHYTDSVNVYNNTIADNNSEYAGGMASYNAFYINLINNIFWNNQATYLGDQLDLSETDISMYYNDIEGGFENIEIGEGVAYIYENNMNSDPVFANTGDHPYELIISSGCINMGTPDTTGLGLPEFDLAGNPRIYQGFTTLIDQGAYEFQGDNVNSEDELISADISPRIMSIYPNPFNPVTTISFSLNTEETEKAELVIYNIKGQRIRNYSIFNNQYSITNDQYSVTWDGTDDQGNPVPSGVYFSKLTADRQFSFRKLVLLK